MEIKAIDTVYNGYKFRSRLEARWAVFFDAANVEFEYEPEGYELKDGTLYLPDFYLPKFELYVEIKPLLRDKPIDERKKINKEWEDKCRKFSRDIRKAIYLSYGTPWDDIWGILYAWDMSEAGGGEYESYARFVNASADDDYLNVILLTDDWRPDRDVLTSEWEVNDRVCTCGQAARTYPRFAAMMVYNAMMDMYFPNNKDKFTKARLAAQQARFEHGENPSQNRAT